MLMCQRCIYVQCDCSSNTGNIRVLHFRRRNKVYRTSVSGEPNFFFSIPGLSSDTKLDGVDELAHLYHVLFGAPELFFLVVKAVSALPCTGGRTAEHAPGFVGPSHCMGSRLCVNPTTMTTGDVPQNLSLSFFFSFFLFCNSFPS